MQHFMTILAQSCDLHPALLQKVDSIGGIAKHEDPLTAPAFCCMTHSIKAVQCLLAHSVQQIKTAC
jgi:hypothetical protein